MGVPLPRRPPNSAPATKIDQIKNLIKVIKVVYLEVQCILEDRVLGRSNWHTQLYLLWSIPSALHTHQFNFSVLVFRKGSQHLY